MNTEQEAKKITFVKKILADGSPCKKCAEVEARLKKTGHMSSIQKTVIADERDPSSDGMVLAQKHKVDLAPFFIVEEGSETRVYTVYFKFVKAELDKTTENTAKDAEDILRDNPDLDFL
ncbi:MAG: hypothetical protein OXC80_05890 [Gammaproteobacteria bacterium]|nr:hypothetical protein [Gammaproteobacteria bacterium]